TTAKTTTSLTTTPPTTISPAGPQWQLTFEDNFNTLNTNTWNIYNDCSTGGNACAWNNELQVYLASQVTVANGTLAIEASNASYTSRNAGTRQFRSGRMDTSFSFAQKYGRFEARIKLPVGQGMWPAFWLLPKSTACWPMGGEIDIMENIGKEPSTLHANYHFGPGCNWNMNAGGSNCGHTGSATTVNFNNDFHLFAVEWTPTSMRWSVDNAVYYTLSSAGCSWPFFMPDSPMYVVLNLAVGGDWPGNPDATTVFPQRMLVDYVRAYKPTIPFRV
ncbi:hypothetical protein ACHHYP_12651, partial [Achlya hypogyna]